ncbi:hypothetical protein LSTR_LSTR007611 [Laodelphax striatellus]|uniref:Inositol hexakisphosphate and diphosphoinositol-pentakisphosphate kinase n=1 Tax=Laodelphax striatellus TaxID=195883 RepID=A0A482WJ56_LAOST|nr:hypothetical protein LSTR_LSTR007611 [Laodelphax striatellus]
MILRELAPTLHIPWSVPFQLDDPPIVPTTFGKMMELRCVVAVIRHGDRTPKQKMKVEVRHPKFFEIFEKYGGRADGHVKLKRPKQLQEILDIARSLLNEIEHRAADPEIEEKQGKLEQLKSVLEMYGHFSGINRKVQMKYQPKGRPRGSSSDDDTPKEPSLVLILKWGGELTPAGRIQAEELGKIFRCMYPGGQGRHAGGEYAGKQGLGLLRLHSTFRHDLKIYASDEGRVQMTAAAFAKGLLALEGELTPILVQMVKSANTNGLLDNDCDASKHQNNFEAQLHHLMQQNRDFTAEDRSSINPCNAISISMAMDFVKNPVKCCERVQDLLQKLMNIVRTKKDDPKTKDAVLYHGETWELMGRRWGKIEKDFCTKNKTYDISKIPDIYDCIKYDLQHNQHTLQFDQAEELYINAKHLADIVIPQEYGLTVQEKLTISQGICTPLLKKIRADLQRNIEETGDGEETVNRLNPRYSHGVSSPGRHVRTRLYFTSESHVHSLLTVLRYGGLIDNMKDEQWRRAMEYVSMVSELNYMSQIVVMLYEDPTKDPSSDERFHVKLHFSPGFNCCVQKNLPPGPGFRPHSRSEQSQSQSQSTLSGGRSDQEDNCPRSDAEDSSTPQTPARCDSPGTEGNSPVEKKTIEISTRPRIKTSAPIPINVASGEHEAHGDTDADAKGPLTASARLHEDVEVDGDDEQSVAKRAGGRGLSLSFSSAAKVQISNSPETEPRSRSFDHSREQRTKDPGPARRHRHSISGQMSYFHANCGYYGTCAAAMVQRRTATGSTNSLFSTAVISGSSSAPNLRDMIPNTAAVQAALEGCGGVPLIRPLETLHNALSLRQLDMFLDKMSRALLYRTPLSSPPKPSTPILQSVQSPNNSVGWSGPPSFVSSSGPSSPNGLSDFFRGGIGTSDSSDFSASIISNDGFKFGAGPSDSLVVNPFGGETLITDNMAAFAHRDSIEVAELYNTQQALDSMQFYPIKDGGDTSGDLTPVSLGSEVDPYDFTAVQPSHMDNLDKFDLPTCEDEDEEMTLTAFTKEEMSRPRLAEIKWIQDDVPILPEPQKHALGRFECIGAVCETSSSEPSTVGAGFPQPATASCPGLGLLEKQHSLSKIQEGVFEMSLDIEGEAGGNASAIKNEDRRMSHEELQSCFHFGAHHNFDCDRVGRRMSLSSTPGSNDHLHLESPITINPSPVLTLASSLKDESCISRGFVLPKPDPEEDQ